MDNTYLAINKASGVDEFSSLPTSDLLINLTHSEILYELLHSSYFLA